MTTEGRQALYPFLSLSPCCFVDLALFLQSNDPFLLPLLLLFLPFLLIFLLLILLLPLLFHLLRLLLILLRPGDYLLSQVVSKE